MVDLAALHLGVVVLKVAVVVDDAGGLSVT